VKEENRCVHEIVASMRENGAILNFLSCDGCFRDACSKPFRLIDYGASDLENGSDQCCSTDGILIICGDFTGLHSPDPRSPSQIVLSPSSVVDPQKLRSTPESTRMVVDECHCKSR
jgi:hypothetical protein